MFEMILCSLLLGVSTAYAGHLTAPHGSHASQHGVSYGFSSYGGGHGLQGGLGHGTGLSYGGGLGHSGGLGFGGGLGHGASGGLGFGGGLGHGASGGLGFGGGLGHGASGSLGYGGGLGFGGGHGGGYGSTWVSPTGYGSKVSHATGGSSYTARSGYGLWPNGLSSGASAWPATDGGSALGLQQNYAGAAGWPGFGGNPWAGQEVASASAWPSSNGLGHGLHKQLATSYANSNLVSKSYGGGGQGAGNGWW